MSSSNSGVLAFLRRRDNLAKPISLTYNRSKTYPSACGGGLSILTITLILLYLALGIKDIVQRKKSNIQA